MWFIVFFRTKGLLINGLWLFGKEAGVQGKMVRLMIAESAPMKICCRRNPAQYGRMKHGKAAAAFTDRNKFDETSNYYAAVVNCST
jgi:hypothetical protein